jgi:hypothetical protein
MSDSTTLPPRAPALYVDVTPLSPLGPIGPPGPEGPVGPAGGVATWNTRVGDVVLNSADIKAAGGMLAADPIDGGEY